MMRERWPRMMLGCIDMCLRCAQVKRFLGKQWFGQRCICAAGGVPGPGANQGRNEATRPPTGRVMEGWWSCTSLPGYGFQACSKCSISNNSRWGRGTAGGGNLKVGNDVLESQIHYRSFLRHSNEKTLKTEDTQELPDIKSESLENQIISDPHIWGWLEPNEAMRSWMI